MDRRHELTELKMKRLELIALELEELSRLAFDERERDALTTASHLVVGISDPEGWQGFRTTKWE